MEQINYDKKYLKDHFQEERRKLTYIQEYALLSFMVLAIVIYIIGFIPQNSRVGEFFTYIQLHLIHNN